MLTFEDKQKNQLIKKFHILLSMTHMDDEDKRDLLMKNYGVDSSKNLRVAQLVDVCSYLERVLNPKIMTQDRLRKRVIASICGYLDSLGDYEYDLETVKRIACRASKCSNFNAINETKLRSIYNAFLHYKRAMIRVKEYTEELLTTQNNTKCAE